MLRIPALTLATLLALTGPLAGCTSGGTQNNNNAPLDAGVDATPGPDAGPDAAVSTECTLPPRTFWAYDTSVMPPTWMQVASSCRAHGTHGIIYVADDVWNIDLTQSDVDQALQAFDHAAPADPTKGIYELATATFGEPTDVDGNDRVILLYFALPAYMGTQFDGNIRREDVLGGQNSNTAELLYLNAKHAAPTGEYMLGVAAHELEHLIHLNHDLDEEGWLDETMAETSMVLCGYHGDLYTWVANDFAASPDQTLTVADSRYFNYGAGFLFGAYLLQRYGADFITALVEQSANGIASVEATLGNEGHSESFRELLGDWALANFLDAPALADGRWGYDAFTVPTMASLAVAVPTGVPVSRTVEPHAARYFYFEPSGATGSTLEISIDSPSWADLELRTAAYAGTDTTGAVVGSHTLTASSDLVSVPNVGGAINRVVLAVVEGGGVTQASYALTATLQ